MPSSQMEQQVVWAPAKEELVPEEAELASVVARYLEKRGLKKTLRTFRKEAKLADDPRNTKDDLEAIFMAYMATIFRGGKKRKSKKDVVEPTPGGVDSAAVNSSAEKTSAQKIDVEHADLRVGLEAASLALPVVPEQVKPSSAIKLNEVSQEPSKSKKKSRKVKGIVPRGDHTSLLTENGACQVSNEDMHGSVGKGRLPRDTYSGLDDDASPKGVGQETNAAAKASAGGKKKAASKKIASENLTSTDVNDKPARGDGDVSKSNFSDKANGEMKRKRKFKSLSEQEQGVELNPKRAVESPSFSDDKDKRPKRMRLEADKAPTIKDIPADKAPTIKDIPLSSLNTSNGSLTFNPPPVSESKKGTGANSNPEKKVIAEAGTEQDTEGHPSVKTRPDSGSEGHEKGSKWPEVGGIRSFQRVKLEEVVYADPRLQNNSYWAKDGAEVGWGAKAEEILGQVKGRNFRHEKTKKKRGSYKGGAIDLNPRSIKFNYEEDV